MGNQIQISEHEKGTKEDFYYINGLFPYCKAAELLRNGSSFRNVIFEE